MHTANADRFKKWAATSLMSALVLLLTLMLFGPAAVAQNTAFHANGGFANANADCSDISMFCNLTVDVFTASPSGAFLTYDQFSSDLITGVSQDTSGFGIIPNSAFQIQGNHASLNVDTSTVANFVNTLCITDANGNTNCSTAPGGVVSCTWTLITQGQKSQFSGKSSVVSPAMITLFVGTEKSQVALANVNFLGTAFANAAGDVGTNHNTTITIVKQH